MDASAKRLFRRVFAIVLGLLLAVATGATVVVLGSFALGNLLTRFLPFSAFEGTILALLAIVATGAAAWRGVENLVRLRDWRPHWVDDEGEVDDHEHDCEEHEHPDEGEQPAKTPRRSVVVLEGARSR